MELRIHKANADVQETHWWFTARRKIISQVLHHFLRTEGKPSLCDIGCGTGANIIGLDQEFEVAGVDISEFALNAVRKKVVGEFYQWDVTTNPLDFNRRFDCVLLTDVLEHVPDDKLTLQKSFDLVKPGGLLMITVPAYQSLYGPKDISHHHYHRFSKKYLKDLCQLESAEILKFSYFNMLLFLPAAVVRIFERMFRKSLGNELNTPSKRVNNLLRSIFEMEIPLLKKGNLPFGLSLMVVLRKK